MRTLNEIIQIRANNHIENWKKEYGENKLYRTPSEEEFIDSIKSEISRGTPERYSKIELEDEKIIDKVGEALKNNKGCYYYGSVGTGKTFILYGLYRRMVAGGYNVKVWNIPDILAKFKEEYNKNGGGEGAISDKIETNKILLLDDFGAEKQTDWNTEIMYRLINYRYEKMIPTFFASNLSLQELAERNGDRLASRIAEMCEIIKIDGEDKRLK